MTGRHGRGFLLRMLVVVLWAVAGVGAAPAARRKVIIDDDGFGLMQVMLLEAPDADVLGITTVSGNLWAKRAAATALRGLEIVGRPDVPVMTGATFPLLNSEALTERWEALYGKLVWKGAWMRRWVEPTVQSLPRQHGPDDVADLPWGSPRLRGSAEPAALFLIRMVHRYPGEVTIIAGGPMTNLALAQRLDPQFAGLAKELVYMGGSLNPRQVLDGRSAAEFGREYVNSPRREFNMRFDPEAASIVSRSPWRSITVIPVDPSTATQQSRALLDRMASGAGPGLAALIRGFEPGFPLWDEAAAGVWLDPAIVRAEEMLFVDYNSQFGAGYGDMLSWRAGYQPGLGERSARVVREVDAARLEALMVALTARSQHPPPAAAASSRRRRND